MATKPGLRSFLESMKLTPMLVVERIEPCLPLWVERLGFEKTVEVPEGDHLAFVILQKDGAEVMLQTSEAVDKDLKTDPQLGRGSTGLYLEVADFPELLRCIQGEEIVVPERVTFYGMREIAIRDVAGHLLLFSAKA
jgi:uncharacterized glyoxalase superfamily protein PhnB